VIFTLYLTRNGLLEPLGQSQVMNYLRGLSREYSITLITYEKDEDWSDDTRMAKAKAECESHGITWLPQRFRSKPSLVAPALSMIRMAWLVRREALRRNVRLIHARSYIPAAVGLAVKRMTGIPFIFDMRALWPEELITAGRLRRGSVLHRAIAAAERACLREAAAVVSLTHAAVDYLRELYPREMNGQRVAVIPTCADLDRFVPYDKPTSPPVIGCLGTVLSGWFRLDWLSAFFACAEAHDPEVRFTVTTRDDPIQVRLRLGGSASFQERLTIEPSAPDLVHEILQRQIASVMFFAEGPGKIGSSPTRMGEVLGCGVPVVTNSGVGDVARIIREYRVGVLAAGPNPSEMEVAWNDLQDLLKDPNLSERCRHAAESVFSLESGTQAYNALYRAVLSGD
jgi:glycosyltransferase involved in cell wall biosynthesis